MKRLMIEDIKRRGDKIVTHILDKRNMRATSLKELEVVKILDERKEIVEAIDEDGVIHNINLLEKPVYRTKEDCFYSTRSERLEDRLRKEVEVLNNA